MNQTLRSILSTLCNRQRLMLALGVVLVLGVVLFNSLVSVDINGWSSGFTHPLHGGDHFLTMLAVGIWAAQLRGKAIWLLPLTFVGVMSLGGLAGAAGLFIPSAELIILVSGLVFSVFIVRKIRFSSQTNVIIVAFFAFFHGFAHGQEISTSASLISYTLGFMVATLLLHGAGILIVRLLVVIFALFVSQLALAQSFVSSSAVKLTGHTQIINTDELRLVTAPDSHYYRQLLDSGEDGGGHVGCVEQRETHFKQPAIRWVSAIASTHPTSDIRSASSAIAYAATTTAGLLRPQLNIRFLTNGVGVTAPPVAAISHDTPRFCSAAVLSTPIPAHNRSSSLETTCYFALPPIFHTLATSFLTNGVGATSPPVLPIAAAVTSLNSFIRFKRSTALHLITSRTLFSSNSVISNTRFKSRSPPFAFYFDQQRWSLSFTNHLNIIL